MNPFGCPSLSPDGIIVGCTLLSGHQFEGNKTCRNASTGQRWCGYCGTWSCDRHGVDGQEHHTPSAYELERLLA